MLEISQIRNKKLSGEVILPVSKSIANRCLIIEALAGKTPDIAHAQGSHDVVLLQTALHSTGKHVDFEDAGTPLRFFISYAALKGLDVVIEGGERLRSRPIAPLLQALEQLGAEFEYIGEQGRLPLKIKKGLDKTLSRVRLDAGLSSQFLSALLLVAPYLDHGLSIETEGPLISEPYIKLTMDVMAQAGVDVEMQGNTYKVKHGEYRVKDSPKIESDWSAATFIYTLAAMADETDIFLPYLFLDSRQGDVEAAKIFEQFGIISAQEQGGVRIQNRKYKADSIDIDFNDIPDMFPAASAVCAALRIKARFTGIRNLVFKESDRVEAMKVNLEQTGAIFKMIGDNELVLEYHDKVSKKYVFRSFDDHRIAMACSIFAFQKNITIDHETVVKKSFPDYWEIFRKLTSYL